MQVTRLGSKNAILIMRSWRCFSLLVIFGSVTALGGCSKQVERTALSGIVSLDGEPVEDGQVAFEPLDGGKMEFGIITHGEYSISEQFGLLPGDYLVRITGNRATGKRAEEDSFLIESEGDSLEIFEQYIPPQYNTASNLKVLIEPVKHLQQDFELTSN